MSGLFLGELGVVKNNQLNGRAVFCVFELFCMISWSWFYIHRETRYCRHLSQRHWPESCGLCGLCGHLVVLWKISHMVSNQRIFSISLWDHLFVGLSHVYRISLIIEKKRNKNAFTYMYSVKETETNSQSVVSLLVFRVYRNLFNVVV